MRPDQTILEFIIVFNLFSAQARTAVKRGAALAAALLLVSCASEPPKSLVTPFPPVTKQPLPAGKPDRPEVHEPVRGVWLATVSRLDWPPVASVNGSRPAAERIRLQQQSLTDKLDKLKSLGINTVFF